MKQSIQLRLGQHLTMTPQLQQAIRLLQLSALDLQTEIQEALESNLMLEDDDGGSEPSAGPEAASEGASDDGEQAPPPVEEATGHQDQIPDELPVDSDWNDIYDSSLPAAPSSLATPEALDFESQRSASTNLHDHLLWQLNLTRLSDQDHAIALTIIDGVSDDGYLHATLEELAESLADEEVDGADLLEDTELESVLRVVQSFDPPGVAARTPAECVLIQLRQMPEDTPWRQQAMELTDRHLDLLAGQKLPVLRRKMCLDDDQLQAVIALIRSTHPRPGRLIENDDTQYVTPEVFVRKVHGAWKVEMNDDASPRLKINTQYASLIRRADSSDNNTCLKNHLQEARWFIKSLHSRNETILKVAASIVKHQVGFFEYGEEAMKPLVLREVAEDVEMHESTVSRVTTQKYMHTPRGVFEFKYFFSSHVGTDSGGECSATAIRALLKKLVAAEKPEKPLSDQKITQLLADQGIKVARRTVAKYRETLHIPPSNERKRLM